MAQQPHGYLRKVLTGDEAVLFQVRQHPLFLWGRDRKSVV